MKINPATNLPFTTLELSGIAKQLYIGFKSIQVTYGFDMLIATDGINTMMVHPDYMPESKDERVFFCTVRRKVEEDGFENHIGVIEVTNVLPACPPMPTPYEEHLGWNKINKYLTPEYFRKNGVQYKHGRPMTPEDQDKYDREKDRRKYKRPKRTDNQDNGPINEEEA